VFFSFVLKMLTPKRKRILLDFRQKREIVDYFTNHPKCTQQQIADYFTTLWDVPVKRRTVGDILANKESYDTDDDQGTPHKRHRSAMREDMESALYLWFTNARAQNIIITDDI